VFADRGLLEQALTHASHGHEALGGRSNERLEFLGDAVLGLLVSELLYAAHPDWSEGDLTRARHALVNQAALAERARALGLGAQARLGGSERRSGGADKDSVLANVLEAVVGAVYLDGGLPAALGVVRRWFAEALDPERPREARDPKTALQEWAHAQRLGTPSYRVVGDSGGETDEQRFRVEVQVGGETLGCGSGRSKRVAERRAAERALESTARRADPSR
jgi:ribonuclease-3